MCWFCAESSFPNNYLLALYHSQQIRGDAVYEIDPARDVEASEAYPYVKYSTVDEYLNQFVWFLKFQEQMQSYDALVSSFYFCKVSFDCLTLRFNSHSYIIVIVGLIIRIIPILVRKFQNGTRFELCLNLVPNFDYCINVVPSVKSSQTTLTTLPRVSLWIF